eukprot:5305246-Amphidinium_carterae.1
MKLLVRQRQRATCNSSTCLLASPGGCTEPLVAVFQRRPALIRPSIGHPAETHTHTRDRSCTLRTELQPKLTKVNSLCASRTANAEEC